MLIDFIFAILKKKIVSSFYDLFPHSSGNVSQGIKTKLDRDSSVLIFKLAHKGVGFGVESSYTPVIVKWSPSSVPQLSASLFLQAPAGSLPCSVSVPPVSPPPCTLSVCMSPSLKLPLFESLYKEKPWGQKLSQKIRPSEADF